MAEGEAIDPLVLDPTRTKTIGNYVIGHKLGKGTFGKVKAATHVLTGEKVAIKILEKDKIVDVADVERVSRQIHILKLIRHPSIIQLYQIIETPKQLFLIMEYMENGELFDYIVKCKKYLIFNSYLIHIFGRIPQEQACHIFQQIIGGVEYIHKLNIVHRDLKPENLLIDYDRTIRIVDFGLSNTYRKDQRLKTACGSPCYAAPEMIQGKNRYQAIMVDIWSCGVILYAMLCGCLPFEDPQTSKLYQKILSGEYKVPNTLSDNAKDLISKILTVDPLKRFRIEDIRKHKWWNVSKNNVNFSNGIIVGYNRIPVDPLILQRTAKLGFAADFTKKCIEANRHNEGTTTYYLLLKKHIRNGGISKTYLGSKEFDPALIEPPRKPLSQAPTTNTITSDLSPKQGSKTLVISSQPGFRRHYALYNHNSLQKRTLKANTTHNSRNSSIQRTHFRDFYTISTKPKSIPKETAYYSNQPTKRQHRVAETSDLISKKYRETYGTSLVSKSKERDRSSSRKANATQKINGDFRQIKDKIHMNQTINPANRARKIKSYMIGSDRGFETDLQTIDSIYRKPYISRRFAAH